MPSLSLKAVARPSYAICSTIASSRELMHLGWVRWDNLSITIFRERIHLNKFS